MITDFKYFKGMDISELEPPYEPGVRWIRTSNISTPFDSLTLRTQKLNCAPAFLDTHKEKHLILIKKITYHHDLGDVVYNPPEEHQNDGGMSPLHFSDYYMKTMEFEMILIHELLLSGMREYVRGFDGMSEDLVKLCDYYYQ